MATNLLLYPFGYQPKFYTGSERQPNAHPFRFNLPILRRHPLNFRRSSPKAKCIEVGSLAWAPSLQRKHVESLVLLDVTGMMCGACVSRVKSILASDDRVDSIVVNMLTETASIRLRSEIVENGIPVDVVEDLARRLTERGFSTKRRYSGSGIGENVLKKWKKMAEKKEVMLAKSRNKVALAWTLVALCCGSHASHILHSLGIHVYVSPFDWGLRGLNDYRTQRIEIALKCNVLSLEKQEAEDDEAAANGERRTWWRSRDFGSQSS